MSIICEDLSTVCGCFISSQELLHLEDVEHEWPNDVELLYLFFIKRIWIDQPSHQVVYFDPVSLGDLRSLKSDLCFFRNLFDDVKSIEDLVADVDLNVFMFLQVWTNIKTDLFFHFSVGTTFVSLLVISLPLREIILVKQQYARQVMIKD